MALPSSTTFEHLDDHSVADTPACRATNFGHRLELDAPPWDDVQGWFARWLEAHGGKGVQTAYLAWEVEGTDVAPPADRPPGTDLNVGRCMRLDPAAMGALPPRELPPELEIRPLEPGDRAALFDLTLEVNGWQDDPGERAYLDWMLDSRFDKVARGEGLQWAAFDDERPVAYAALFHDDREARFQDVQTAERWRRRGLASAVIKRACQLRQIEAPTLPIWICANADEPPERVYRRLGFVPETVGWELSTPAPRTDSEIRALTASFEAATLSTDDWRHREHVTAAVQMLRDAGGDVQATLDRLRDAILRFLDAHGIETTKDAGYHETLTRGWLELVAAFLAGRPADEPLEHAALGAQLRFGDKLEVLKHWSRDVLSSWESRRTWVEPDLAPIRGSSSP